MGDYNRNDRGGGRFSGGGRDFGRREMHRATCAQCGKDCEVPFRPNSDRPVYCSDCFEKRRNESGGSRQSDGRGYGRPNFEERRSYSPDRGNAGGTGNGQLIDQLKSLNVKLDKIISILEPKPPKPPAPKIEITDVVVKPKAVKAKAPKKKVKKEKVELA